MHAFSRTTVARKLACKGPLRGYFAPLTWLTARLAVPHVGLNALFMLATSAASIAVSMAVHSLLIGVSNAARSNERRSHR